MSGLSADDHVFPSLNILKILNDLRDFEQTQKHDFL